MTTLQIVGFGLAGTILYSLLRKKSGLTNLIFYPKNLKAFRFDGLTPVLTFGIAVQNTSNQSFTLNSFAGEVYKDTTLIGNISTFNAQTISANSEKIIYADARLSLLGIVSDLINAITNKTFSGTLELDAHANIDNLQVPIDLKFKIGKG